MTSHHQTILQAAAIIERIEQAERRLKHAVGDPRSQEATKNLLTEAYRDRTRHKAQYPWVWLSPQEARGLVQAIASTAEKSYRRGIQQGEAFKVSKEDARWFRYDCCLPEEKQDRLYRFSIPAPQNGVRRKVLRQWPTCVDLLDREVPEGEVQNPPFAALNRLIHWYQKKFGRGAKEIDHSQLLKGTDAVA